MGRLPWEGGTSRKHLLAAIDASLQRLGTDYVDLFQLHRDDEVTPLDETLEALDTIVRSGRARYVGVSNWSAWRIARALGRSEALGLARPVTVQPRYNLLFRQFERDLLPMCAQENLATLCYNPLAGGLLTGKHRDLASPDAQSRFGAGKSTAMYKERYWHEREFDAVGRFVALAGTAGIAAGAAGRGLGAGAKGVTCAIIGASRAEQLPDVLAATESGWTRPAGAAGRDHPRIPAGGRGALTAPTLNPRPAPAAGRPRKSSAVQRPVRRSAAALPASAINCRACCAAC